jgi:hypothetical protein
MKDHFTKPINIATNNTFFSVLISYSENYKRNLRYSKNHEFVMNFVGSESGWVGVEWD